jgi:hypothetical protein
MLRRLLVGSMLGLVAGGALAAALIAGLGMTTFAGAGGTALGYATAALAGILTGLVAGKPIWASGAKTEAGLKAFFGALLAAGAMFALRQWAGGWTLDLHSIGAGGPASVAELPAAALPLIAAVIGGLFELDNTGDGDSSGTPEGRKRVTGPSTREGSRARVPIGPESEEDGDAEAGGVVPGRAKR